MRLPKKTAVELIELHRRDMTQTELAKILKISAGALSNIMSGKRPVSDLMAMRLADAFGLVGKQREMFMVSVVVDRSREREPLLVRLVESLDETVSDLTRKLVEKSR